jgi:hypothetical protein
MKLFVMMIVDSYVHFQRKIFMDNDTTWITKINIQTEIVHCHNREDISKTIYINIVYTLLLILGCRGRDRMIVYNYCT